MDLQAIIDRAAAGDEAAHRLIVERFYERVRGIVHRQLEHDFRKRHKWILPLFSTRDIVQEVFAQVTSNLEGCSFEEEGAFVAYLSTMVKNRLLDAVRFHEAGKRDQRRQQGEPEAGIDAMHAEREEMTPELAASLAERATLLREVMQAFPPRHRTLLELRMMDDTPFPQIAAELGYSSAETARQAFLDAKAKLLVRLRTAGIRGDQSLGTE